MLLAGVLAVCRAQEPVAANARISEVAVYGDRAMVTRTAAVQLSKGEHVVRYADLPPSIDRASLQASGRGKAVIRDVRFVQEQLAGVSDEKLRKLMDQREKLQDSLRACDDRTAAAQAQKTFIDNIARKLTDPSDSTAAVLDPGKWTGMVAFYRKSIDQYNGEVRAIDGLKRELSRQIDKLNREINDLNSNARQVKNLVDVVVEARDAGPVEIDLSCIVYGPSWTPAYTVRVSSDDKKMNLIFNAYVRQNTGESWDGVTLKLSTAVPSIGGVAPELSPWYVDIYKPRPMARRSSLMYEKAKSQIAAPASVAIRDGLGGGDLSYEEQKEEAPPEMEVENSTVASGASAALYTIPGKKEIASDNQDHQVSIAAFDLPVEFAYASVPKLQPNVFLKATAANTSDYAFLPGATSIFLDNAFVSSGTLDLTIAGAKFETSLGVDQGIHIEYKQINRYQKDQGVVTKKTKMIYEYAIILKSNKKSDVEVAVKDQYPVSKNADIVVTPIIPEKGPAPVIDNVGLAQWKIPLKPGQEMKLPVSFSVEYPRDANVEGL
jgi:uncharacterized protein (TIGR02231 family)